MLASEEEAAVCPDCEGRGWLVEADDGAGSARPCACRAEQIVPQLLEAARVPPRYKRCTFAEFQVPGQHCLLEARRVAEHYVESFIGADGGFCEQGLLFAGPTGTGKTHLASAVLSSLVRRYRVRGLFTDFTSLIHEIQSTFDPSSAESKHQVLDPVMKAEVLVLDELGAQKPTDWVSDVLYLIMNYRYTNRLATIFTTNYQVVRLAPRALDSPLSGHTREPISQRIRASLLSRLFEMVKIVDMDGSDFRETKAPGSHL